jgi:hypothetical protein
MLIVAKQACVAFTVLARQKSLHICDFVLALGHGIPIFQSPSGTGRYGFLEQYSA